jgi:hypothetical protein
MVAGGVGLILSRFALDDERLATALRTLLDLGHRGVHPTPEKTSMTRQDRSIP